MGLEFSGWAGVSATAASCVRGLRIGVVAMVHAQMMLWFGELLPSVVHTSPLESGLRSVVVCPVCRWRCTQVKLWSCF